MAGQSFVYTQPQFTYTGGMPQLSFAQPANYPVYYVSTNTTPLQTMTPLQTNNSDSPTKLDSSFGDTTKTNNMFVYAIITTIFTIVLNLFNLISPFFLNDTTTNIVYGLVTFIENGNLHAMTMAEYETFNCVPIFMIIQIVVVIMMNLFILILIAKNNDKVHIITILYFVFCFITTGLVSIINISSVNGIMNDHKYKFSLNAYLYIFNIVLGAIMLFITRNKKTQDNSVEMV